MPLAVTRKAPSPSLSVTPATVALTLVAAIRVWPLRWSKRKSPDSVFAPSVSCAPITLTVTVGPAGRSSSATVDVLTAIEIVPPVSVMPGSVRLESETVSRPATPVLVKTSRPVASLMSTNVPSLSSEVVGSLLTIVTLTVSPVASTVKSAVSAVPAIVSVVFVPVTTTLPGAKVAVSSPAKLTPGSVVVTVPLNAPLTPVVAIFRLAAPLLTVTRPPPRLSAALVTSISMSAPSRVKVMSPLSFWPATSSVPPVTARRTKPVAVSSSARTVPVSATPGTVRAKVPLNEPATLPALREAAGPVPW